MYASFEDYIGLFGGRAIPDEAEFNRLAPRADAVLDRLTRGRAARYRDQEGKLKMACCAVTEKLYELETAKQAYGASEVVAAEKVGDHRVEYRRIERTAVAAELEALAEMYLFGTGLLYRGIPVYEHDWEASIRCL